MGNEAKGIAKYMVQSGIVDTEEGNVMFSCKDIADVLKMEEKYIESIKDEILEELSSLNEVAECDIESDIFYITFFTDFCPNVVNEKAEPEISNKCCLTISKESVIKILFEIGKLIKKKTFLRIIAKNQ